MKVYKFLFSGTFMGMLLVIFAIAMGYATFIENDFDSTTAKMLVYGSRWFEVLMLLMVINFSGMIYTKRLFRKSKINVLLIHLSLIVIIVGAAVTRYIGYEGMMHIRAGQTTNLFVSSDNYVNALIESNGQTEHLFQRIWMTPANRNIYDHSVRINGKEVTLKTGRYLPNAQKTLVTDASGTEMVSLVIADRSGRNDVFLKAKEPVTIGDYVFVLGDTTNPRHIQLIMTDVGVAIRTPKQLPISRQSDPTASLSETGFLSLNLMTVFSVGNLNVLIKEMHKKAIVSYMPNTDENSNGTNVVEMSVSVDGVNKNLYMRGGIGQVGHVENFTLNGVKFSMNIGAQQWALPFSIRLNEFQLERYPGSNSPSSFASDVTLIDEAKGIQKPFRVFMNNVLDYDGFRFYQSSYDRDEKGTIFSVNHDYWGTLITYIGYALLFGGLFASLFTRKNRFARLKRKLKEVHEERQKLSLTVILLFLCVLFNSNFASAQHQHTEGVFKPASEQHAAEFGSLLIQNKDGRIIPVNTISDQILMKVYKKSKFEDLSPDQVILGFLTYPNHWQNVPIIKVRDEQLQKELGINGELAPLAKFFDAKGQYLFRDKINEVYNKKPALRSTYDKELVYVDERVNVLLMGVNGSFLRALPLPGHPENKWADQSEYEAYLKRSGNQNPEPLFTDYIHNLQHSIESGNYQDADAALTRIKTYQQGMGKELMPPALQTKMEILYNKISIFKKLFPVYMLLGFVLLGIFMLNLFKPSLEFKKLVKVLYILLLAAFIIQTLGLVLRGYISGHEPWSNGYESMIYISWAVMLAGFIFQRSSAITLSVTSILAGITLLTAHMSWMNPEITNLVPVLKSYWLTIHVATITASYGFLGLSCMMGFLNLCIMIFRNRKNLERVNLTIKELTYIIEMSMMVGLVLLVIGNFLGGVWANESWGRYWGWDPKETWSLVTIIVYSFILHMSLIPSFKNLYSMNFAAMVGFGSVLMTYFGVNYYLSGLHSYAAGDPVPVPSFVYYVLIVIAVISLLALLNVNKMRKEADGYEEAYAEEEND